MHSLFSKFIAYIQEPRVRNMLLKRLAFSLFFTTAVGIGSLGFPQEAHAIVPLLIIGAVAAAGLFGINMALESAGSSILEAIGAIILSGLSWVMFLFLKIGSYFLYVAGSVFNYALVELVFEYARNFGNSNAVLAGWNILRDFGNIALLFGFVWIGIATILNITNYTAKKALPRLLIFAVLINFSLLVASAVIDTSNAFSYAFYNHAASTTCGSEGSANAQACATSHGLSATIIGMSGVMGWGISEQAQQTSAHDVDAALQGLAATMLLLIFITILMVVLFAAAIMLAIRAVTLTLLIITSPVGFVGMVVPFLGGIAKDWWGRLINQSFFAPVYLLLLLITLKIMEGVVAASGQPSLAAALTANNNNLMGQVVMMIMLIAFLIAALVISNKIGAYGARGAIEFAGKTAGFTTFGLPALGARFAARRVAEGAGRLGLTTKRIATIPFVGKFAARQVDKMATKSWDPRGIKEVGQAASMILPKETGIVLGKSGEAGGYRAARERREKLDMDGFAKVAKGGPNDDERRQLRDHDRNLENIQRDILAAIQAGGPTMAATLQTLQQTRDQIVEQRQMIQDNIDERNRGNQYTYLRNTRWESYIPFLNDTEAKRNAERQMSNHLTRSQMRRFIDDLAGALPGAATLPTPPAPRP